MIWSLTPLAEIPELELPDTGNPFLSQRLLELLHFSGSCNAQTGWETLWALPNENSNSIAMPVYLKDHSYGEYVFDFSWANAYHQSGLPYYPKLLTAIPFTPSTGPRLFGKWQTQHLQQWTEQLPDLCRQQGTSGWHLLFPDTRTLGCLTEPEYIIRQGCQFHWHNADYRDFDDFLDRMTSRRRKGIRKERKRIAEQGVSVRMIEGTDMSEAWLRDFFLFYHTTYLKRGQTGYLTESFFRGLLADMAADICFALAFRGETLIAGALFFKDDHTLYGRYWGASEDVDCLHFEVCYYQGIEYAIRQELRRFDPGTQGEHKIPRGFEPTATWSAHWLAHREFHELIRRHMQSERKHIQAYMAEAETLLPFKVTD